LRTFTVETEADELRRLTVVNGARSVFMAKRETKVKNGVVWLF
jgi:hypothetical protein